jgi:hypothetical protein
VTSSRREKVERIMPEKQTIERAKRDKRQGKATTTQAGEFVREEMHHIREGKHGARSTKQAIAIGLSKARRAGVPLKPPSRRQAKAKTRKSAQRAYAAGQRGASRAKNPRRSRAVSRALAREPHKAASKKSLASQARGTARRRGHRAMSAQAKKGARTRKRAKAKH